MIYIKVIMHNNLLDEGDNDNIFSFAWENK